MSVDKTLEYIAQRGLTVAEADIIYASQDDWGVKILLPKRCPSAAQAQILLIPELQHLLPLYTEPHIPGYGFLQKVKKGAPKYYPVLLDILNDKANAQIFATQQRGIDIIQRRSEAAKRKLGFRGQSSLLNCKEIEYVKLYLQHDALDEPLMMKLADADSTFGRQLFKVFLDKYALSVEAQTVLRQSPHAALIA